MATLREAVSAILGELMLSQDRANQLTRRLAKKYRDDTILQIFPVPNQQLKEVEIELLYGIDSVTSVNGMGPVDLSPSLAVFRESCSWIAVSVMDQIVCQVRERETKVPPAEREGLCALLHRLGTNEVRDGLTQRLANHLLVRLDEIFSDGELDRVACTRIVQRTVIEEICQHPELESIVELPTFGERLLDRAFAEMEARLVPEDSRDLPDLNVFFNSERLAKLPDHAVQRLRIRVERFGTQWVVDEDGTEHLVPEE